MKQAENPIRHISIIVPHGHASLVNIEGTHQIFNGVNGFCKSMGKPPLFQVQLVGLSRETRQTHGLFTINPEVLLTEVSRTDLIIIPAMHGDQKSAIAHNKAFIPWIIQQYSNGAELASFCIGAFFLAATGLLNGRQCATHWMHAHEFRNLYPEVLLVDDKIMTEEHGIYTSGGAYSYLNLLLYLIEKHAGRELAIMTSKTFMIDIDRESQSPFIMFRGQKAHEDHAVRKAQEFIEHHYQDKITVDQLASRLAVGRRSLERRFKKATSNTVTEYIQRVKIEAAKKSFEVSRKNINEVMYEVGYSDTKAFRTVFKKITNLSPIEYKNKYNKGTVMA